MDFEQFLKQNDACPDGIEYAKSKTLQEIWETCPHVEYLIWLLDKLDFPVKTLHEIAVLLAENVFYLTNDKRSKRAVERLRWHIDGGVVNIERLEKSASAAYWKTRFSGKFADADQCVSYSVFSVSNKDKDIAAFYCSDAAVCCENAVRLSVKKSKSVLVKPVDIVRGQVSLVDVLEAAQRAGIDI